MAAQALLVSLAWIGAVSAGSRLTVSATLVFTAVGAALPITLVGAVVPDLDEPRSHVYRWFRPFVAACSALYVFVLLFSSHRTVSEVIGRQVRTKSPEYLAGIATVCLALLICIGPYRLIARLLSKTPHRGLFHQLPTGLTVALVLYPESVLFLAALDAPRPPVVAAIFAVAFLVGFVSHLAADRLLLRRRTYIGKTLDDAF